jgi:deoxyribodipyrimidine photolyase-related protein
MQDFFARIAPHVPTADEAQQRCWIYVPYDRLHEGVGPLAQCDPKDVVLVFMESRAKAERRPYHKKKLVLVLSAMRHFALEQAERGCRIVYGASPTSFAEGLIALQDRWQWSELVTSRPAERELRVELRGAREHGLRLRAVTDTAWLSTTEDFQRAFPRSTNAPGTLTEPKHAAVPLDPPHSAARRTYLMDTFYRAMRRSTGLLMKRDKPVGGKWSYDAENRRPWRGEVDVPQRPQFPPDAITREVIALVDKQYPNHFGTTAGFDVAVTRADAEALWAFTLEHLMPHFGPWEDAMSLAEPDLFHSMTSPLVNLTLLRPRDLVDQVAEAYEAGHLPLPSAEGFIRQLLGWREFVRHLHEATDGFRTLDPEPGLELDSRLKAATNKSDPYAGAAPNFLDAQRSLPPVYWGSASGMMCMDTVVAGVVADGWSHHITRLMVLSNLATLAGYSPRQLTDWFWFGYIDAYDWVVEPNVLGMSTFADGGLTATKPYVSGAAYIDRMSDFCGHCALDPKKSVGAGSCPFTALYWSFLERHEDKLKSNPRLFMPMNAMRKRSAEDRKAMRERAEAALVQLDRGERVS